MPRASQQPPNLDPNTTYVAWQSFSVEIDGYPVDVQKGTRLRDDHDTVRSSWWYWLPDGAAPTELAERVRDVYPDPEVHVDAYERAKSPPPLRDEDAMVCIRTVSGALALSQMGIAPGEKVRKDSPAVQKNADVDVVLRPLGQRPDQPAFHDVSLDRGEDVRARTGSTVSPSTVSPHFDHGG